MVGSVSRTFDHHLGVQVASVCIPNKVIATHHLVTNPESSTKRRIYMIYAAVNDTDLCGPKECKRPAPGLSVSPEITPWHPLANQGHRQQSFHTQE